MEDKRQRKQLSARLKKKKNCLLSLKLLSAFVLHLITSRVGQFIVDMTERPE